jgi:plastocyanin
MHDRKERRSLRLKTQSLVVSTLTTLVLLVAVATPANAVVVAAGPGGFAAGYATPVAVAPVGGPLIFVNGDIQPHNVVAFEDVLPKKVAKKTEWCKGYPKTKCPLFWSETAATGGTAEVQGLENAESGQSYVFFCSIHPAMKGTLTTL